MRRVTTQQLAQELYRRGFTPPVTRRALGDYSEGDPNIANNNIYNERDIFRGENTSTGYASSGDVSAVMAPITVVRNRNFFNLINFAYQLTDGSRQLLPSNEMRTFLTVQNQSLADLMYVNFTSEAGVNVGLELYPAQALIFDTIVPYNSINILVNSATAQIGAVCEGALQL